MDSTVPPVLTLYHREGCHLCETMHTQLQQLQAHLGFSLTLVDIDSDEALFARFRAKIPVLALGQDIICCHFLDEDELKYTLDHV
ncbi:glutaredoxin family protein [Thiorhodospira sibirica]|uniref:glutaredoxin family protein n=1 Tax=Thiorhodospira sibirica TaxID=154347 RepID=UPI00022C0B7B|nr:glutaredoxin family protein [Thiorhodospira sibirica]